MVGDGVNDAAAMARATVGVGVHGGAEASLAVADVYLSRPGLSALDELMEGSERTLRVIRRNIAFSLVYNLAGAALAMGGWINPLIAAILMPASSHHGGAGVVAEPHLRGGRVSVLYRRPADRAAAAGRGHRRVRLGGPARAVRRPHDARRSAPCTTTSIPG